MYKTPIFIVLIGTFISLLIFGVVLISKRESLEREFYVESQYQTQSVSNVLLLKQRALEQTVNFFEFSEFVSYDEFDSYVQPIFLNNDSFYEIGWLPAEDYASEPYKVKRKELQTTSHEAEEEHLETCYQEFKTSETLSVSEVLIVDGRMLITLFLPLFKNNNFLGMVYGSIDIEILLSPFSDIPYFKTTSYLIQDTRYDGDITFASGPLVSSLSNSDDILDKKHKFFSFEETLDSIFPWKIIFVTQQSQIWKMLTPHMWGLFLLSLFSVGILGWLFFVQSRQKDLIEKTVAERTQALEEITNLNQTVFDTAPILMGIMDNDFTFVSINAYAYTALGYEQEDFVGTETPYMLHIPEELESCAQELSEKYGEPVKPDEVLLYGMQHNKFSAREWTYVRADGSTFPVLLSFTPLIDKDGKQFGILGVALDITNLKKVETQLKDANAELEEFAYRTSHDLRAPIIASLGLLDLMDTHLDQGKVEDAKAGLYHAQTSLSKLRILIEDILKLNEAKNKDEEAEVINLEDLVKESLGKLSYMDGFDRLTIETNFENEETLHTKKLQLAMILENMLSNAIKYQNFEEKKSFIHISSQKEDGNFIIDVRDNGIGIPKGHEENMFEMFKRFHPKVAYGSGLGLYLMRKSADLIGGTIEHIDPGKGAQFRLTIRHREDATGFDIF